MAILVASLITEVRNHTGTDVTDLSDTDVTLLLNRAYWELIDRFKFREKEALATIVTVGGTNLYNVPSPFEAIQLFAIEDPITFKHDPLIRMTEYDFEQNFTNNPSKSDFDKPIKYFRRGNQVYLWRTPDKAYTITVYYWTTLADLDPSSNNTVPIPQVWDEIILWGGIARAYKRLGDFARGQASQAEQDRLITQRVLVVAKEEVDTHRGGLDVIGYDDTYFDVVKARDVSRGLNWPWSSAMP